MTTRSASWHTWLTPATSTSDNKSIYTTGLLEPLKTDVELLDPQDIDTAMLLTQANERRLAVVTEVNKVSALKPRRLPPPKATMTTTTATMPSTTTMGAAAPTSPFKA
jgi:hypothetical protein